MRVFSEVDIGLSDIMIEQVSFDIMLDRFPTRKMNL